MLRSNFEEGIEIQPRKKFKFDVMKVEDYDQFKGEAEEQMGSTHPRPEQPEQRQQNFGEQVGKYQSIFESVKQDPRSGRKLKTATQHQVKIENDVQAEVQSKSKKRGKEKQKPIQYSENWRKFLEEEAPKQSERNLKNKYKPKSKKNPYEFVSMDCQFVKGEGDQEYLARVSLVNEHGDVLYDSYVKPTRKIVDYVTPISGITFNHIKNAPSAEKVLPEIKAKLIDKILVGHTILKDLEVCGLKDWKGLKACIDIADFKGYSPNGKRVSLKNLSYRELGKSIQDGWHSSVEDSQATMQLFLKNRNLILKQANIIKK